MDRQDIVVYSHLGWHGVFQRPQQIISRLAKTHRILYVEEPWWISRRSDAPHLRLYRVTENLTVLRPIVKRQSLKLPSVSSENRALVRELLSTYFREHHVRRAIRWHYNPMAHYAADLTEDQLLVYDCMDDLSSFAGAPPELIQAEAELLRSADVVFTGGATLFETRRRYNRHCYRFDSGVDVRHFARASEASTPLPADVRSLKHPIIGYYGVVDERIDYKAIQQMARAHPEWSILLVGPVFKVDPSALPRAPNIHYRGQRTYDQLPGYLKSFDVASILFADNAATRSLSPTKTLEYFAGRKPVVSGPVPDVIANYGDVVRIARSPKEWVSQVEAALSGDQTERIERGVEHTRPHDWDTLVSRMDRLMTEGMHRRSKSARK